MKVVALQENGAFRKRDSDRARKRVVPSREITVILDLVRLRVSQLNQSLEGASVHMAALEEEKVSPAKIQQVENWCDSTLFDADEKIALTLAELISCSCESMTQAVLEIAQDHFSQSQISFIVIAILAVNDFEDSRPETTF